MLITQVLYFVVFQWWIDR